MTMPNRVVTVCVLFLTAGCASPLPQIDYYDVETEALRKIRTMTVINDAALAQGAYRDLGEVKGIYCDRNQLVSSPERSAIDQLKIRAAQNGADHIGTPSCETRDSWDLTNNCLSSTTCSAEALAIAD